MRSACRTDIIGLINGEGAESINIDTGAGSAIGDEMCFSPLSTVENYITSYPQFNEMLRILLHPHWWAWNSLLGV